MWSATTAWNWHGARRFDGALGVVPIDQKQNISSVCNNYIYSIDVYNHIICVYMYVYIYIYTFLGCPHSNSESLKGR